MLGLDKQRAMHLVLKEDVCIILEEANLCIASGKPSFRMTVEKEDCRTGQFSVNQQPKAVKQLCRHCFRIFLGHASRGNCMPAENIETFVVKFIYRHAIHGKAIPFRASLVQNELRQGSACQHLLGRAAADVEFAMIAHWC